MIEFKTFADLFRLPKNIRNQWLDYLLENELDEPEHSIYVVETQRETDELLFDNPIYDEFEPSPEEGYYAFWVAHANDGGPTYYIPNEFVAAYQIKQMAGQTAVQRLMSQLDTES